jgi:hypothetical protein
MSCRNCHGSGPTAYVELHHNVGMLLMRQEYATIGELCRSCLHGAFARHMLGNLVLGWWGMISFFMTWYFLGKNVVQYTRALRELSPAGSAAAPTMPAEISGAAAEELLTPFRHNVRLRLQSGERAGDVAQNLADLHNVRLADARRFVDSVVATAS